MKRTSQLLTLLTLSRRSVCMAVAVVLCCANRGLAAGDVYFWRTHFRPEERFSLHEVLRVDGWIYGQDMKASLELRSQLKVMKVTPTAADLLEQFSVSQLHGIAANGAPVRVEYAPREDRTIKVSDRGVAVIGRAEERPEADIDSVLALLRSVCSPSRPVALGETFSMPIPMAAYGQGQAIMRCHVSSEMHTDTGTVIAVEGNMKLRRRPRDPDVQIEGRWMLDPVTGRVVRCDFEVSNFRINPAHPLQTVEISYHAEYAPGTAPGSIPQ